MYKVGQIVVSGRGQNMVISEILKIEDDRCYLKNALVYFDGIWSKKPFGNSTSNFEYVKDIIREANSEEIDLFLDHYKG